MSRKDFRYELKYVLQPQDLFHLESTLMTHPAGYSKVYEDRIINNIYFDDHLFSACDDNLSGIAERIKIRYRWYGAEKTSENGVIEYKIKKNALGTKVHHRDIPFSSINELTKVVNAKMPHNKEVLPVIRNQYLRSYYLDISEKYRLTVDRNVIYAFPSEDDSSHDSAMQDNRIIVEIKFDKNADIDVDSVIRDFPFRLSKHSKYLSGMHMLYM